MRNTLAIICVLLTLSSFAQNKKKKEPSYEKRLLTWYETRLMAVGNDLVECREEQKRDSCLHLFNALMDTSIRLKGAYEHAFDSVRNVSRVTAPDNSFRIFTWTFRSNSDSFTFYGFIQFPDDAEREEKIVYLHDSSSVLKDDEILDSDLSPDRWYGALYYDIIMTKRWRTRYYTLVGWDGYTSRSSKKLLDVISFDDEKITFGLPIFKMYSNRDPLKRVIWEHADRAVMTLRYESRKNIITFEHLMPPTPMAKGEYSLYLPDGTYDYFRWKRGKWVKDEMLFDNVRRPTRDN